MLSMVFQVMDCKISHARDTDKIVLLTAVAVLSLLVCIVNEGRAVAIFAT